MKPRFQIAFVRTNRETIWSNSKNLFSSIQGRFNGIIWGSSRVPLWGLSTLRSTVQPRTAVPPCRYRTAVRLAQGPLFIITCAAAFLSIASLVRALRRLATLHLAPDLVRSSGQTTAGATVAKVIRTVCVPGHRYASPLRRVDNQVSFMRNLIGEPLEGFSRWSLWESLWESISHHYDLIILKG